MTMPPLGLWYLAAQLEAQGHTTDFFALDVDPLPNDGDFDQMWVSATSPQMGGADIQGSVRWVNEQVKDWKKTATVLGGAGPWARPDAPGCENFDLIVAGESDHPETVRNIVNWRTFPKTKQSICKTDITQGPLTWVRPPVRRWDDKYHFYLTDHDGKQHRTTTLFTSRGCPMACAFCESGRNGVIWDRFVRYEPVETVDAQLREIVERGHTAAMFYDDIMPLNKPRTRAIIARIKDYGLIWRCFVRTDVITAQGGEEYIAELAESGLVEVLAGVESADNRIKNNIHKGTTIEQDTQVLRWCKKHRVKFKASFIFGLPGEDADSLARTRDWILAERPDRVDVNALIPFPGTPITRSHDYLGNEYDVEWTGDYNEERFYKGAGRSAEVVVRTKALSSQDIDTFRSKLIADIQAANIPY